MKLKIQLLSFLLLTLPALAFAQNARSILDKAHNAYNQLGGVTATFSLDTKDTKNKTTYSSDGKAYMKGNKFKIEIPDGITWFDGKTQWVYLKDTEEVNVSNPTGAELQSISPAAMFGIYKSGFNLTYKGEKKAGTKTVLEVELTPTHKSADIAKILVQIDKATNVFSKITLFDKSGYENVLTIKNFQKTTLGETTFSFNKNDYPKAEIVDLR